MLSLVDVNPPPLVALASRLILVAEKTSPLLRAGGGVSILANTDGKRSLSATELVAFGATLLRAADGVMLSS